MEPHLEKLPEFAEKIKAISEIIITNIILIGQIPSPTFKEDRRAQFFLDRLSEFQVDECTMDGFGNAIGIIRGTNRKKAPIFVTAHLDTFFDKDIVYNFTVKEKWVEGPGILDNTMGVGVLASLPEIFRRLDLRFESDIVLSGVKQSIGKGNLRGIRNLLKTWPGPIRSAICLEGHELGRLNYFSDGMRRCEIRCSCCRIGVSEQRFIPNAILILHDVINEILKLRLPQRPRTIIVIGKTSGGVNHGQVAEEAELGFEIRSFCDKTVKAIYNDIRDIVQGIGHENGVDMKLTTIGNLNATTLKFNHPLVKNAASVLKKLNIKPVSRPSESSLSIFLARRIPAVTLGISTGENRFMENAKMHIEPMIKGIAQVVGVIMAIDSGVCDVADNGEFL